MVFSNDEYFIGNFERDMVQGEGKFYCRNGQCV